MLSNIFWHELSYNIKTVILPDLNLLFTSLHFSLLFLTKLLFLLWYFLKLFRNIHFQKQNIDTDIILLIVCFSKHLLFFQQPYWYSIPSFCFYVNTFLFINVIHRLLGIFYWLTGYFILIFRTIRNINLKIEEAPEPVFYRNGRFLIREWFTISC